MVTTVFLSNLNFTVDEARISNFFSQIGNVIDVKIVQNECGNSKGCAFVTFEKPEDANKACELFNNKELFGRNIKIEKIAENKDCMNQNEKQEYEQMEHSIPTLNDDFIEKMVLSEKRFKDLENKIDDLKKENKIIMKEMNYFRFKDNPRDFFLIPINQNWVVINPLISSLTYKEKTYTVTVSSIDGNASTHYSHFLFDGRMENENGARWATNNRQNNAFVIIQCSKELIANVLFMGSRDQWYNESPTSFEVFGIDQSGNHFSLYKNNNVVWKRNEKKYFRFDNSTYYFTYRISFYSCLFPDIFGLAELNLGYIPD